MRGIFVLVLVGCGRIAFDPLADATTDTVAGASCVAEVASNGDQACARRADGRLYCWGDNSAGQLGDGTFENRLTPVPALIDQVTRIFGGEDTMCAMRGTGLWCWGEGSDGQVGDGGGVDREVPVEIFAVDVTTAAVGQWHTCAGRGVGGTSCWGDNSNGNLGVPASPDQLTPLAAPVGPHIGLAIGDRFTCALRINGTSVDCWGRNGVGELGTGNTMDTSTPTPVVGIPNVVLKVIAGCHRHACALTLDNQVYCWGDNEFGQVGTGGVGGFQMTATHVDNLPPAVDLAMTTGTTCALASAGEVWCWGRNEFGEAGNGGFASSPVPAPAMNLPTDIVDIDASCTTVFGIRQDRTLVAWGGNLTLGTGETTPRATAAVVPVPCD